MVFHSLDGTTVLFPTFGDRALMGVTPLAFLSKVLATNRSLGYRNVAEYDIDSIFKRMLASACVTSYEIKAERKGILERVSTIHLVTSLANIVRSGCLPLIGPPYAKFYAVQTCRTLGGNLKHPYHWRFAHSLGV